MRRVMKNRWQILLTLTLGYRFVALVLWILAWLLFICVGVTPFVLNNLDDGGAVSIPCTEPCTIAVRGRSIRVLPARAVRVTVRVA